MYSYLLNVQTKYGAAFICVGACTRQRAIAIAKGLGYNVLNCSYHIHDVQEHKAFETPVMSYSAN